jgi:hypothetical protein
LEFQKTTEHYNLKEGCIRQTISGCYQSVMLSTAQKYYALPHGNIWHERVDVLKLATVAYITLKFKIIKISKSSTPSLSHYILHIVLLGNHDKWVPVTTAWCVLRLRMEERPPVMEGSCKYFE